MDRFLWIGGCVGGAMAVAVGAFAAHALGARVTPGTLSLVDTAARYQMYHSLALLAAVGSAERFGVVASLAGWLFLAGIVLFSGSLYLLAATGWRGFGVLTPLGGGAWIAAWLALAWSAARGSR